MIEPVFTRRKWLKAAGGASLLLFADSRHSSGESMPRGEEEGKSLYTLETGHQADRGGPITVTKHGRVLWFTTEPEAPYLSPYVWPLSRICVRESKDAGDSWGAPKVVTRGTQKYSVLSHAALQLRSGVFIHIHVHYSGYDHVLNPAFIQYSYDVGKTWTRPSLLPTGERYISDVLSVTQISTGRVIYPFGFLTKKKGGFKVSVLYSDDEARTWSRSPSILEVGGAGFESGASEPSVAELPDGRLWMLIRAQTGFLWESFSLDRGRTWEPAQPSKIPCSNSPGTMLRLSSGKIAVVWNNHVNFEYARQSLAVGITEDGRTFSGIREIEHTDLPDDPEAPLAHVTYPFLAERSDGAILVSYNKGHWLRHNRAKVACAELDWIETQQGSQDFRDGRVDWCTRGPGSHRREVIQNYASPEDNQPGASLEIRRSKNDQDDVGGMTHPIPLFAEGEMQVTLTVLRSECYLLWRDTFLAPGKVAEACLRVRFSKEGAVFMAAGLPTTKKQERRGVPYSYLAYPITTEQRYPKSFTLGKRVKLTLRFSAAAKEAHFRIDGGPELALTTGEFFGLCYFGIAVEREGVLNLRRFGSVNAERV